MMRISAYLTILLASIIISASAGVGLMTHPLSYGLVGWWPLNEGTGTNVIDYSGLGVNGTTYVPVPNGPSFFTFTAPSASYSTASYAAIGFALTGGDPVMLDLTPLNSTFTIPHDLFPDTYDEIRIDYYDANPDYLGSETYAFPYTPPATNFAGFPGGITFTLNTTLTTVTNPWSLNPRWTNGVVRNGYKTVSTGNLTYITMGTTTKTRIGYPLSIAGWCRRDITTSYAPILARRLDNQLQYQLTWIRSDEPFSPHGDKIRLDLTLTGSGINSFNSTNAFTSTGYHHLAGTYDGTNVCLYFDAVLVGKYPETRTVDFFDVDTVIGASNSGGEIGDASFDDVRLYRRALSSDEVRALYGGGYGAH